MKIFICLIISIYLINNLRNNLGTTPDVKVEKIEDFVRHFREGVL